MSAMSPIPRIDSPLFFGSDTFSTYLKYLKMTCIYCYSTIWCFGPITLLYYSKGIVMVLPTKHQIVL